MQVIDIYTYNPDVSTLYSGYNLTNLDPTKEVLFYTEALDITKIITLSREGDLLKINRTGRCANEVIDPNVFSVIESDKDNYDKALYVYNITEKQIIYSNVRKVGGWYKLPWGLSAWSKTTDTRCGVIVPHLDGSKFYLADVTSNFNPISLLVFFNYLDLLSLVKEPTPLGIKTIFNLINYKFGLSGADERKVEDMIRTKKLQFPKRAEINFDVLTDYLETLKPGNKDISILTLLDNSDILQPGANYTGGELTINSILYKITNAHVDKYGVLMIYYSVCQNNSNWNINYYTNKLIAYIRARKISRVKAFGKFTSEVIVL